MQDAFNLAWKLALVVRKTCDEHLLESYSPERSSVGDEVLKAAGRLTAIGTMRNPVAQTVRNLVGHVMLGLSPVQHAFADTMTEVTIGYPKSPLNGPSLGGAGPKPGERVVPIAGQVPVGSRQHAALRAFRGEDRLPRPISSKGSKGCSIPTFGHLSTMVGFGWSDPTATSPVRLAMQASLPAISTASFNRACSSDVRVRQRTGAACAVNYAPPVLRLAMGDFRKRSSAQQPINRML